jgi:uncharacterized repeat protein (TIGR02543 family)
VPDGIDDWIYEETSSHVTTYIYAANAASWNPHVINGPVENGGAFWQGQPIRLAAETGIPTVYTVTFNAEGGTVSPASKTVTQGQPYGELPVPQKANHIFGGWHTEPNGGGMPVSADSVASSSADHTLYAKWTAEQQQTATPAISPPDGAVFTTSSRRVVISCATEGAEIRFTTDGSDPTVSSPLYTGSFNIHATTTVKARAFKSGMTGSEVAVSVITRSAALSLAEALDVPEWTVTTGGDAQWTAQTTVSHDGADAARSGVIGTLQTTWMETTVSGAGTLTFWWRASCEDSPDDDWDYLAFSVDGAEQARVDGDSGWRQVSVTLDAGEHALSWAFTKDGYDETVYEDCAWVDQVVWTPAGGGSTATTPVSVPHAWLDAFGLAATVDYETAALDDSDWDGLLNWQEYVAGTDPNDPESVFRARIEIADGVPVVLWEPDLRPDRVYTVEGKTNLTDGAWHTPTNTASRFFRVKVAPAQ